MREIPISEGLPGEGRPSFRRLAACFGLIALCLALAFSNSFSAPFVFDDGPTIVDNPAIRSFSPGRLLDGGLCPPLARRPVVSLSLAVNFALGGLDVRGYHAFNFGVHLASALILLLLLDLTFRTAPMAAHSRRALVLAFACALLWAVHPLQVTPVTYAIQRCESLMGLFFLATVYAAARGFASKRHRAAWHATALAALALSAGSKEVAAMAPAVVFAYDLTFFGSRPRRALARSPVLYGGMAAALLAFVVIFGGAAFSFWSLEAQGAPIPDRPHNSLQYALTQPRVLAHYLFLSFWPGPLTIDHAWKVIPFSRTWPHALALLALVLAALRGFLARRPWAFAVAWCLLILLPTSSLFGTRTIAVEYRMYLPLAGITVLAVLSARRAGEALVRRGLLSARTAQGLAVGLLAALALALMVRTWLYNHQFRSRVSVWEEAVRLSPDHPRPRENLASALVDEGRYREAIEQDEAALRLSPGSARALTSMALAFDRLGEKEKALDAYKRAYARDSGAPGLSLALGNLLVREGNYDKALELFQYELAVNPYNTKAMNNVANILVLKGRLEEAIEIYRKILDLESGEGSARGNLGMALVSVGRPGEALEPLARALKSDPDNAQLHKFLGVALARTGDLPGAAKHLQRAVELDPSDGEAGKLLELVRKGAG